MFNNQIFNGVATKRKAPNTENGGDGGIRAGSDEKNYFNFADFCVTGIKYLEGKNIAVNRENFGNSGVIYNEREELQKITIEGYVKAENRAELLEKIDFLKTEISGKKFLKISDAGNARRVLAMCVKRDFSERRTDINMQICKFDFETYDYWENVTPVDIQAEFSAPYNFNISRQGNAEAKFIGIFTVNSVNNATEMAVKINDSEVKISRNFSPGEVIKIDGEKMQVSVNGESIGFSGWIPKLKNQNNAVKISSIGEMSVSMITQYRPSFK